MNNDSGSKLLQLAELHARSVNLVEALQQQKDAGRGDGHALQLAMNEERDHRAALIRWKPQRTSEAELKIQYLIMYLIKTKKSLDEPAMRELRMSVAHLSGKWPW